MTQIGSYTIGKQIGEGEFGRTFLATHNLLGYKVVLKQEKTALPDNIKLFKEEALILQKMRHFGLPALLDYFETQDFGHVMALSWIEGTVGGSLNPVTDEHLFWILDRIFSALSYLHGHWNIIHCDLKPDNMIIDLPNHMVTLIDLGMALVSDNKKAKGGTPGYMAPELELGLPPIPQSDIYSVGKVAIALTGGDVLAGECPSDMHPKLREAISKMILKDPRVRPGNVDKLRADFCQLRVELFKRSTSDKVIEYRSIR